MPRGRLIEILPVPAADAFDLVHDYDRRLDWDTLLQAANLTAGYSEARVGAVAICKGRWLIGGLSVESRYVSFCPPFVAAVKMTNRPFPFDRFAATIRHRDIAGSRSSIEYVYTFTTRPRCLRRILDPVVGALFRRETRRRLRSLREFLVARHKPSCA